MEEEKKLLTDEDIEHYQEEQLVGEGEEDTSAIITLGEKYIEELRESGIIRDTLKPDDRWAKMEDDAMRVYEEGLNQATIPFKLRKSVADKVLEIRGIIKKPGDRSNGSTSNTYVFSPEATSRIFDSLGAMNNNMRIVNDEGT